MLRRSGPIRRKTELKRTGWLKRTATKLKRRYTGPSPAVRQLVWERSGGACEWPDCAAMAVDLQHRLARKMGGRGGVMAVLLNSSANLLAACRPHHERITSAHGPVLAEAQATGWVLLEGERPDCIPVLTRHGLVLLDDYGNWRTV